MNDRMPVILTLLLAALLVTVLLSFQPYSADWPGTAYAKPARSYIRAAMRQDSVSLLRLSVSGAAVAWALRAAREHPDTLALWGRRIRVWTGGRRGDTTEVFVYGPGEVCGESPIVFRFVGSGKRAKVLQAHSACLDV